MNLSIIPGMPVLLTGGAGRIGSYVAKGLADAGYIVKSLDRVESQNPTPNVRYVTGDITDFNFVMDQMDGMSAVLHLAALPDPRRGSTSEVMRINVMGGFHVFQAAVKKGLRKVVQASSINYLGIAYGKKMFCPEYFPIDEKHPPLISDVYSLSKKMDEEIAEYFWNRDDMPSFSLRFPGVISRSQLNDNIRKPNKNYFESALDNLEKLSESERIKFINDIFMKSQNDDWRKNTKRWEDISEEERMQWATADHIINAVRGLYAYLELSDCLQAIIKCLQADLDGSHPLFVVGPDTGRDIETMRLIKIFFPQVKKIKRQLHGNEPLVSNDKARAMIGFEPKFSTLKYKEQKKAESLHPVGA